MADQIPQADVRSDQKDDSSSSRGSCRGSPVCYFRLSMLLFVSSNHKKKHKNITQAQWHIKCHKQMFRPIKRRAICKTDQKDDSSSSRGSCRGSTVCYIRLPMLLFASSNYKNKLSIIAYGNFGAQLLMEGVAAPAPLPASNDGQRIDRADEEVGGEASGVVTNTLYDVATHEPDAALVEAAGNGTSLNSPTAEVSGTLRPLRPMVRRSTRNLLGIPPPMEMRI